MNPSTKRKIGWSAAVLVGLTVLLLSVGPLIPCRKAKLWVCAISGSTRTDITWFGYFHSQQRSVSPLENWIKVREPDFAPQWQPVATYTHYVLGYGCGVGNRPEIYQLRSLLGEVVEKTSEERIARLVAVLRHGSADEQRQMVESLADEVLSK